MRLDHANVTIRPRSRFEALDLGSRLAARYRRLLVLGWLAITLPVFAVLTLLCWNAPGLALLLFWWGKPLYERLPLHILAQALFDQPPSLGQALRAWPRLAIRQGLASLAWRRFSLTRSFDLPVVQLEGLTAAARRRRLGVLHREAGRGAGWLTVVGAHVEASLTLGAMALLLLMVPHSERDDSAWVQWLLGVTQHDLLWLQHVGNALYVLVLAFWGPIYVACGFTSYLNRRIHLEGWDIELTLRTLRQRLLPTATLAVLFTLLAAPPATVLAADIDTTQHPRLSTQAAHQAIEAVVDHPPFRRIEQRTRWQWRDAAPATPEAPRAPRQAPDLQGLATAMEILLWLALAGALAWLAWHYRQSIGHWARRLPRRPPPQRPPLPQLFGLDLAPETLPDDLATHAEQLWPSDPRQALALLYRGLLSRLIHDYKVPLRAADTEGQVLASVQALQLEGLEAFSHTLTGHWQAVAYGHRLPPASACDDVCQGWRRLFPKENPA